MPNPFNPLNWVQSAQNWFRKTELSSGFRPYLIFLLIHTGFALVVFTFFRDIESARKLVVDTLYVSFGGFIILFAIKCFQDPAFCRSEKHVENVQRLQLMEQKGDAAPQLIESGKVEIMTDSDRKQLSDKSAGSDK